MVSSLISTTSKILCKPNLRLSMAYSSPESQCRIIVSVTAQELNSYIQSISLNLYLPMIS